MGMSSLSDRIVEPPYKRLRDNGLGEHGLNPPQASNAGSETVSDIQLSDAIDNVSKDLSHKQKEDGHWLFELEADATIPAEFILLNHYLGEIDTVIEGRLASYIRSRQAEHGGWSLFHGGGFDLSCTVKAYFALKLVGDDTDAAHMKRARDAVLNCGGAQYCNVFTRTSLALFEQLPWRTVPSMPIEIMYFPVWFPFNLNKIAYWSRTTLVPLLILMSLRPRAKNPCNIDIQELFTKKLPTKYELSSSEGWIPHLFLIFDGVLKVYEKIMPRRLRRKAVGKALNWCLERLNGDDGLGGIFPPMANLLMALDSLGFSKDHKVRQTVRRSLNKLLTPPENGQQYCQPCVSPVWDTGLAALALSESNSEKYSGCIDLAADWLVNNQITDIKGDWAVIRPTTPAGGWAFQYKNDHYPDVDDTAVVGMFLHRTDKEKYEQQIRLAAAWIEGMQSKNGGWGSFDAENQRSYLNHIPFADHGALLDPPTVDVTARCISFLTQIGYQDDKPVIKKGINYLLKEQEKDGSWFGRWGTNYIYGTWSAISALRSAGIEADSLTVSRAVGWLQSMQRSDGGWGETGDSYYPDRSKISFTKTSTPSQTAWALLALMAAGELNSDVVKKGINFLLGVSRNGSRWLEDEYTAVGFPRVFYLKYHGYSSYFPLWALARYRFLQDKNDNDKLGYGI